METEGKGHRSQRVERVGLWRASVCRSRGKSAEYDPWLEVDNRESNGNFHKR